jgi:hypothetical protein
VEVAPTYYKRLVPRLEVPSRPNCDIGRVGSGRPLHPTADIGTLSVQEQKSGGPDAERAR